MPAASTTSMIMLIIRFLLIYDILSRNRLPFLVGGTGLYVDAVADGYEISDKAPDHSLRAHLETFETPELYEMLKQKLPDTDIDPRNRHRVMRALEKLEAGDVRPAGKNPRYELLKLGVTWPREILKQRIDERLERRLQEGMVEEVKALLDEGVSEDQHGNHAQGKHDDNQDQGCRTRSQCYFTLVHGLTSLGINRVAGSVINVCSPSIPETS